MAGAAIVDCGSFYYTSFYYAPFWGNMWSETWARSVSVGPGRRKVCRDLRQKEMYNKKTYNKKTYNTEVV